MPNSQSLPKLPFASRKAANKNEQQLDFYFSEDGASFKVRSQKNRRQRHKRERRLAKEWITLFSLNVALISRNGAKVDAANNLALLTP